MENVSKLWKCWKNLKSIFFFFAFKIRAICLQICPDHPAAKIRTWRHIVYLNATSNMARGHNVTSRITTRSQSPGQIWRQVARCWKVKKCFLDFSSTLRNIFYRFPTTRNQRKKNFVSYALKREFKVANISMRSLGSNAQVSAKHQAITRGVARFKVCKTRDKYGGARPTS